MLFRDPDGTLINYANRGFRLAELPCFGEISVISLGGQYR
jgi:hypothetical protein